ncbi:VanZ family protein [Maricaulis parjimensis]|uniref:VanZ family protein n=1 Tax=Maricaulis parjimensis TaxID=144023 RepID=UPI00193AAA7B|nr:VanZ family protein [Maricaulis parjimensis]
MGLRWGARLLLVVALVVITDLALQPASEVTTRWLGTDKIEHMAAFVALTILIAVGFPRLPRWLGGLALLAYGIGIELAQAEMGQGRHASLADIIADALGILLALILISLTRRLLRTQPH